MLLFNRTLILILTIVFTSCTFGPYYDKSVRNWKETPAPDSASIRYSVYLVGDAGGAKHEDPTLRFLQSFIEKDSNSAIVYLGDNIYHDGLPGLSAPERSEAEERINAQMNILKNFKGEIYFVSGNHDWEYMGPGGLDAVKRQEEYVENYLSRGNTFVPDYGCPGPFYTRLSSNVALIAIDSQWWLHKYEKPYGRCGDCDAIDEQDMLIQLEDYIRNNRNRNIVIVAHHPLMSEGNHGGYYNILDYIFPLRLIRSKWYVPLPVIGSLYPLYRKFGGSDQDLPHYRYQQYKNEIESIIQRYDNVVYAAGHDHNLQLHQTDSINHIISGSGSKTNPVKGSSDALYTHKHHGFSILRYYDNDEVWVEFWIPEGDGTKGRQTLRYKLYTRSTGHPESYCSLSAIDYKDSCVTVRATDKFRATGLKPFFLGNHYREEWVTPVTVPLLDLKTEKGGLIPYGIGGGKQSISLKLRNVDDKEYVLRSINKDPTKAVPLDFRNTFVHELVQDQISAQHPYGALTVPALAEAIGVYHTNPKLVLIPNDSCLGPYREQFQNMLAVFEEDPDENHENVKSLGYSKNIVGTDRMRDRLESDNDNRVDEENFLKARMLDMIIGDWDRHERQFRWATIKMDKGELYRPVPEDRDQVYFKFDGLIPYFASRRWAVRNLKNFDEEIEDVKGLNQSARLLDRRFLTSLSREDWIQIADSVKQQLTDDKIQYAIQELPPAVFDLHGPEIISKLKKRRDQIGEVAVDYYEILAKYVDVFGSDMHEKFVVEREDRNKTRVRVYKTNKEGEVKKLLYDRTFLRKETKEIRLYGLAGNDHFEVKGKTKKGIKVRIIGGSDEDTLTDQSKVAGFKHHTVYYDTHEGNVVNRSNETNVELSKQSVINYPSQDRFFYNYLGPRASINYNYDDGIFFGLGTTWRKYKFRGTPYGSQHSVLFAASTSTRSTRFDYKGDIKDFVGGFDLGLDLDMYTPAFVFNFFGYGNESPRNEDLDIEFYRVRLQYANFNPSLNKDLTRFLKVGLGPKLTHYKPERNEGTFLSEAITDDEFYSTRNYAGLRGFFRLGTQDNERNPTRGILLTGEANLNQRLDESEFYSQYLSDFSFYITPNLPIQLTFASRVGGGINVGEYEFYQANALGNTFGIGNAGNLRGFRKTRFIGDKSFYNNNEVRAQLFRFNTYIFSSKFGVLGFFDNGRVWARGEDSNKWHFGYGGGIWLDLFNRTILNLTYSLSDDDDIINFRMGFLF